MIEASGFQKVGDAWKAKSFNISIVPVNFNLNQGFSIRLGFEVSEEYDHEFPRLSCKICECGDNLIYKNRSAVITKNKFFEELVHLTQLQVSYSKHREENGVHLFQYGILFYPIHTSHEEILASLQPDMENVYFFDGATDVQLVPRVERYGLFAQ